MRSDTTHQTQNLSPTKQKFNTLKNFLKNKSSLNDLRSKVERKEKDKEDIIFVKPEVKADLRESKSATKLSEFKFKVPKKKRSLGSLVSHTQSTKFFDAEAYNQLLAPHTSPPNLVRDSSVSTKSSKTSKQSPPKLSFTHDELDVPQKPYTTLQKTPEMPFLADWATPTSIRGTYVHDWSNNMSPRSLTESLRVGRVGNLSPKLQLQNSSEAKMTDNIRLTKFDLVSDSEYDQTSKNEMKLDLSTVIEPSHPLPSPRTPNTMDCTENVDIKSANTKSEKISNTSLSSSNSVSSVDSEFSFLVNRAASIKFYKSKEQLQKEADIDLDKKEKQKIKDFLGTSEDTEFELFDEFPSNSKDIISGFDEDVNYVNYEEEDDTDALFNRDLFGISSHQPAINLEFSDNEDTESGLSNNETNMDKEYDYKPPAKLELSDDEYDYNPPLSLELPDNEIADRKASGALIGESGAENRDSHTVLAAQDAAAKRNRRALNNEQYETFLHDCDTNEQRRNLQSTCQYTKRPNSDGVQQMQSRLASDLSSKQLLEMLNSNNSGLSFRSQTPEVQIKHTPSAKIQRHRSLKFHQLSADIEESYFTDDVNDDPEWKNIDLLKEVNDIPEDFDFEHNYHQVVEREQQFSNNLKKGRLSTMIVSNSCGDDNTVDTYDQKHHVWKNLISRGGKKHVPLQKEKIHFEDKTITLFNTSGLDDQNYANDYSESYESDHNELSTIME
ncbi:hypothetical protein CANINC_004157 [Pichia inconspicua]|uniref:Uncharacterized protein n=1 Tax=Pichia inconspicua TaxID=52247 RepID=A0A4T0WWV3_9ASCO|nr:hypothetical protein CANINC_004157 [[Candida] inconspicua]